MVGLTPLRLAGVPEAVVPVAAAAVVLPGMVDLVELVGVVGVDMEMVDLVEGAGHLVWAGSVAVVAGGQVPISLLAAL